MSEPELKPCPFCGSEGITERRAIGWIVRCAKRNVGCGMSMRTHHAGTFDQAVEAWNTRFGEPQS